MHTHKRTLVKEKMLAKYSAVLAVNGSQSLNFRPDRLILPLGSTTFFSMRWAWDDRVRPCQILAGYKAYLEGEKIVIGKAKGNIVAYHLGQTQLSGHRGYLAGSSRRVTREAGQRLESVIEQAVREDREPDECLALPCFWAGFRSGRAPDIEDIQAAQRLTLTALQDGYEFHSMRAHGGKITIVAKDVPTSSSGPGESHSGIKIGWGGTSDHPDYIQSLPSCAVLEAFVREGAVIEPKVKLGHFAPVRLYPGWSAVVKTLGQEVADWALAERVMCEDVTYHGLHLRRAELCPSALGQAETIFECLTGIVDAKGGGTVQVLDGNHALTGNDDCVEAELRSLRPEWIRRFKLDE